MRSDAGEEGERQKVVEAGPGVRAAGAGGEEAACGGGDPGPREQQVREDKERHQDAEPLVQDQAREVDGFERADGDQQGSVEKKDQPQS